MKVIVAVLALVAALGVLVMPTHLTASEQVGIYTIVERVVLEPNDQNPERIQLWGVFATNRDVRNPKNGYMYFTLPATQQDVARKEWSDFKAIAGKGQVVGFGMAFFTSPMQKEADTYYAMLTHVRRAPEKPQSPDVYPLHFGIQSVTNPTIVDSLKQAKK